MGRLGSYKNLELDIGRFILNTECNDKLLRTNTMLMIEVHFVFHEIKRTQKKKL